LRAWDTARSRYTKGIILDKNIQASVIEL